MSHLQFCYAPLLCLLGFLLCLFASFDIQPAFVAELPKTRSDVALYHSISFLFERLQKLWHCAIVVITYLL